MSSQRATYEAATRIWSGPAAQPLSDPNASIATALFHSLSRRPDHVGQINDCSGVRLTNGQIRRNAVRLAMSLQRQPWGVRPNDVIGLVSKNNERVSAVVFAAFALAAPINTLDANYKADEIAHMFRLTRPCLVFCDSDAFGAVAEALGQLDMDTSTPIVTVDRRMDATERVHFVDDLLMPQEGEQFFVPNPIKDGTEHTALVACSSGTTGHSKGVRVSHGLLLQQTSTFIPTQPDDVYLSFSSLYWLTGIMALVASTLSGITRIITTRPFDASLFLEMIERYGATITLVAPYHLGQLLHCPHLDTTNLRTMRLFMCGGGALAPEHVLQVNKRLPVPITNVYGISEIGGLIAANVTARPGSVGHLHPGVHARVLDELDGGCGPGEDGEIYVRHDQPIRGYWGDDGANAEALDAAGWFRTGDIGHFDADGCLYLVDRKKDIMKYQGHQISPSELEAVVLRCPGVAQVCVVGVFDERRSTDLPVAVVVRSAGGGDGGHTVQRADIEAIVKDTLSDVKQLRGGVYFVKELPLTPSGKVLRRKVKEMVTALARDN